MTKASDNQYPKVTFLESSAPSTPASGLAFEYVKTDGKLYFKNDAGTETELTAASGPAFHGVHARKTATFPSLTNATFTTLALDGTDVRDTDAYHDPVTNNSRLTVPTGLGGDYVAWAKVGYAANATGARKVGLMKNGVLTYVASQMAHATTSTQMMVFFLPMALVATDYIEFQGFQASGGSLSTDEQECGMYRVGT